MINTTNKLSIGISLTCFRRLDYLTQVVGSIKKAIEYTSYKDFIFYPSIDYYDDSIVNYLSSIDWIPTAIVVNKPPIGCNRNTYQAITNAISKHDAVIHLEDDTVPTKDSLEFYVHMLHKYQDDPDTISISGYNKTISNSSENYYATFKEKFFCCWGCAFWTKKIDIILNNWTNQLNFMNPQSWDSYLQENLFKDRYYQVRPHISRIQNIGAERGTYVQNPIWHYYNHRSPFTSDNIIAPKDVTWS